MTTPFATQTSAPRTNGSAAAHRKYWPLFVLFYAVIANSPFWVASHWLGLLPIGWVCVEYAAVGLVALVIPRAIASLLLLLMISVDILSAVSKTYYMSPTEALVNSPYLCHFSNGRLWAVAGVISVALVTTALPFLFPVEVMRMRHRVAAAASLVALILIALTIDYSTIARETGRIENPLHSRPSDVNRFSKFSNLWVGRYPLLRLSRDQALFTTVHHASVVNLGALPPAPSAAALAVRLGAVRDDKPVADMSNLVLILVESWGFDWDPAVRNALVAQYFQPNVVARYHVLQGTIPFHGSTVGGEVRELCGSGVGLKIMDVAPEGLRNCLPDRLISWGYHSVALHGMDGRFFDRSIWYRNIGFQDLWFRDRFRQRAMPECVGAFVGTCDTAIDEFIAESLRRKTTRPAFFYWVTLNSHLPAPTPSGLRSGSSCSSNAMLSSYAALCSWYQLVSNVQSSTAQLAISPLGRPTVFAIVGDHAPPFANPELRSQFSSQDVPYILLIPR